MLAGVAVSKTAALTGLAIENCFKIFDETQLNLITSSNAIDNKSSVLNYNKNLSLLLTALLLNIMVFNLKIISF